MDHGQDRQHYHALVVKTARRHLLLGLAAAVFALGAPLAALAQGDTAAGYPNAPIYLTVPFPPGGAVDIIGRLVAKQISLATHQPVVVENRPGADGNVGAAYVVHARPDGYNLLFAANGLATNQAIYSHRSFDELVDLTPVAYIGYAPLIMMVPVDSPAKSIADVVAAARKNPGALSYASAGYGSSANLAAEGFKSLAHVDILHVPYKGGAPAITDLIAGRTSFMFLDPVQGMPFVRGGKLRPIFVGSNDPLPLDPSLQTARQAGYANLDATVWWGVVAPAKTPPAVVAKLNSIVNRSLADAQVKQQLASLGIVVQAKTPQQFLDYLKGERAKWGPIVKAAGIHAD
jgi:tripartite-type tricarboxylate transporter receptor subunit TctC